MKTNTARTLTMIVGILTALVVVFSQVFYFDAPAYAKKNTKTGEEQKKANEKENGSSYITLPSISQPTTSTNVEADHELTFLEEILFEEKGEQADRAEIPLSVGKFFQTLFRAIISPNAP